MNHPDTLSLQNIHLLLVNDQPPSNGHPQQLGLGPGIFHHHYIQNGYNLAFPE
jgi:hypothetical protein